MKKINITVRLENDFSSEYETIVISKEDLMQLACNKAKDKYIKDYWNNIQVYNDEIEIIS